jgi:microcystin-dependent protein
MDSYIGTIIMFAGNYAPQGWLLCDGSLLAISQYQALFSILSTTYGGDGVANFALPDLRSRVPVGTGMGPGLSLQALGEKGGAEAVTLTLPNLAPHAHMTPKHTHGFSPPASTGRASATSPAGATLAAGTSSLYASTADTAMLGGTTEANGAGMTDAVGGGLPFGIMQPYLSINFIICVNGLYPPRP